MWICRPKLKTSTLQGQLGTLRATLATQYAKNALNGESTLYPASITGAMFADGTIPVEPFASDTNIKVISAGLTAGNFDNDGGWIYSNTTGEIRADYTDSKGSL